MKFKNDGLFRTFIALGGCTAALLMYSCASMRSPQGGPRDEDPPMVVRTYPRAESTGFAGKHVYMEFDELVNVKDAFTNVVISPPQASVPKVTSSGRRVMVDWSENLLPNTTYTIDFGQAIEDVNEGNKLGAYSFSFSTGDEIDSLRISGVVLDAATLEPQQGMLVGVHSAEAPDSAFRTLRFERATKTDDHGRFTLRGLKDKTYNLFALGDLNNDYRWDNPAELLAFYPMPVTPYAVREMTTDSVYNITTGAVDTVISRERTMFLPNNLLLSVFDTGYKAQYLVKEERPDSSRINLIFNTKADKLPEISLLKFPGKVSEWAITEHSETNDTITYWITNRDVIAADTLKIALSYLRTGDGQRLVDRTDTLTLTKPKIKAPAKQKKTKQQLVADSIAAEKAKWFTINTFPSGALDITAPLILECSEPVIDLKPEMIRLEQKVDTIYKPLTLPSLVTNKDGKVREYSLTYPWEPGESYRMTVDSTAMKGVSNRYNATMTRDFTIKKKEDYASLTLRLEPDSIQGFVEVLNTSDTPVASARVKEGVVRFPYLSPADYYARFIACLAPSDSIPSDSTDTPVAKREKLEFHTGNYDDRVQPDEVYYYPGMLSLKRHDRSERWNLNSTAVDMQKPDAIKKNKPTTKNSRRNKENNDQPEEDEEEYFDVTRNPFDNKSKRNTGKR